MRVRYESEELTMDIGPKCVIVQCFCEAPSAAWDLDLDLKKELSSGLSISVLNQITMTTKLYFYEGIKAKNHFYMWQQSCIFFFVPLFQMHINVHKRTNTCIEDLECSTVSQT